MSALKKRDYAQSLIEQWATKFKCPHCEESLFVDELSLVCPSGHRFDGSKQGTFVVLKQANLRSDKLYDKDLFLSRRAIMEAGAFRSVYKQLKNYMSEGDFVIDMGSGEGYHDVMLKRLNQGIHILGMDLAKEGVKLASDFLAEGVLSIVADLSQMPLKDQSVDLILNILSPSNEQEMNRVLKEDGTILKIVPQKHYLIELRESLNMEPYEPNEPDFKTLDLIERIAIKDDFPLTNDDFKHLLAMTPLSKNKEALTPLKSIHIDLELWVLKKKAEAF